MRVSLVYDNMNIYVLSCCQADDAGVVVKVLIILLTLTVTDLMDGWEPV